MTLLTTPPLVHDFTAKDFNLLGTDGNYHSLHSCLQPNGLVIVFMCNHCPYVQAIIQKMIRDSDKLRNLNIGFVGINSNDFHAYPDDSFDNMQKFVQQEGINFPYLIDPTQDIARAYNAVCTPDFFGFNKALKLRYRGRLDSAGKNNIPDAKPELILAMEEMISNDNCTVQNPSMGCSLKWRQN
jgi:peroxiredoxin